MSAFPDPHPVDQTNWDKAAPSEPWVRVSSAANPNPASFLVMATNFDHYDLTTWGPCEYRIFGDMIFMRGSIKRTVATPAAGEGFLLIGKPEFWPSRWSAEPVAGTALLYVQCNMGSGVFSVGQAVPGNWIPMDGVHWSFAKVTRL